MEMFLFLVCFSVMLAVAQGGHSTSPTAECSGLTDGRGLMAGMLNVLGFNEKCIATCLDSCSSAQEDSDLRFFIETVLGEVQRNDSVVNKPESRPRHCKDLLVAGDSGSGVRQVHPNPEQPDQSLAVYCDQDSDGGGWTVFQRRVNNSERENFFRSWQEYQAGFGDLNGEFWLGLDSISVLSSIQSELRVDLYDYTGQHRWAKYGTFQVGPEDTNYHLTIGRYRGDAGDSMAWQNNQEFSTRDDDNDKSSGNCAKEFRGAWWYNACTESNLNGYQYVADNSPNGKGITWAHWRGQEYSLKRTTMMLRPAL